MKAHVNDVALLYLHTSCSRKISRSKLFGVKCFVLRGSYSQLFAFSLRKLAKTSSMNFEKEKRTKECINSLNGKRTRRTEFLHSVNLKMTRKTSYHFQTPRLIKQMYIYVKNKLTYINAEYKKNFENWQKTIFLCDILGVLIREIVLCTKLALFYTQNCYSL